MIKFISNKKGVDTSSENPITANDVVEGKEGFVNGEKITGTMINNGEINITPSSEEQTIPEGYTSGGTVIGNENLVPENIKEGISIFNVEGTLKEGILSNVDYEQALSLCDDISGKHIYGIRKPLNGITLERTDNAVGKIAEATHDGHPENVTNDFDNLYPWSDMKSFMYDSNKEEIIAWYGDKEFTFTPEDSNVNVFTRIPRFWYKRYKDEQYEYWKIADYAAEGFTEFAGCSPARYSVSGSIDIPRSVSGNKPLDKIAPEQYRVSSKLLGNYNGLLDIWSVCGIQMLYLVEYANADSQNVLGQGLSSDGYGTSTGGCDNLGMKSGCVKDDGKTAIIYRGFESIFGHVFNLVDGIKSRYNKIHICEDWTKYNFEKNTMNNYTQLTYSAYDGGCYTTAFGLDEQYPLIMIPIDGVGYSDIEQSFTKDYFQDSIGYGNDYTTIMEMGGLTGSTERTGIFYTVLSVDPSMALDSGHGARFLLHKIS